MTRAGTTQEAKKKHGEIPSIRPCGTPMRLPDVWEPIWVCKWSSDYRSGQGLEPAITGIERSSKTQS